MQVQFKRWSLNPDSRTPISVNPERVDATETFGPAFKHNATQEEFPAATKVVMKNGTEYVVQGDVDWVTKQLNREEK